MAALRANLVANSAPEQFFRQTTREPGCLKVLQQRSKIERPVAIRAGF
jgi:hypothetical protein